MVSAGMVSGLLTVRRWSARAATSGAKAAWVPPWAWVVTTLQPGAPLDWNAPRVPCSKPSLRICVTWQGVAVGVAVAVKVGVLVGVRVGVEVRVGVIVG